MSRLISILILLAVCLGFGIYSSARIVEENESLQQQITKALEAKHMPPEPQVKRIAAQCRRITDGIGIVLNDDRVSTVSYQAHLAEFAAGEQDEKQVREALFILSRALEDLANSEQVTWQSLL